MRRIALLPLLVLAGCAHAGSPGDWAAHRSGDSKEAARPPAQILADASRATGTRKGEQET